MTPGLLSVATVFILCFFAGFAIARLKEYFYDYSPKDFVNAEKETTND